MNQNFWLFILLVCLVLILPSNADGQKIIQLEKAGTLKTKRLYIGDVITFRLVDDDKGWYERMITDIDVDNNRIISGNYVLRVEEIDAIRLKRKAWFANFIGAALQIGGVNTVLFAGTWAIFSDYEWDWTTVGVGALNFGIGTLLRSMFRNKVFKPGKRKRIRLLDLTFYPDPKT